MTRSQAPSGSPFSSKQLPPNIWSPQPGASIMVHWQPLGDGFEVALQLIDPALLTDDDRGIIVWSWVGTDRTRLPFSLADEVTLTVLLSGTFEWRQLDQGAPQLWLYQVRYPGGYTAAAQIA
jgi:hypothetical protein